MRGLVQNPKLPPKDREGDKRGPLLVPTSSRIIERRWFPGECRGAFKSSICVLVLGLRVGWSKPPKEVCVVSRGVIGSGQPSGDGW
mmetsp:Transcript_67221/g.99603  ORF Transcript_67221/g.99603 Transcript_67221/m.99603 type:complete len:86 (+) Transcript_67221:536-793(+)